jgi:phosphonate transport system substrate-binding protein
MEPFQQDVEAGLKAKGFNVHVAVRIYPTYDEAIAALVTGEVDFARLGPASYIVAKERSPKILLLACEGHEGTKQFSGVIVVRNSSSFKTLADLKGKSMAFGDPTSTTGRYLAQAVLAKAGITAKDFANYDYLGRHDKVIFAVASGAFDAGAANERTFEKYAKEKDLRELYRFPSPTQAWVAQPNLSPKLLKVLRETLLEMKGEGLEYIGRNGFLPASDADYDDLRKVMKASKAFGG